MRGRDGNGVGRAHIMGVLSYFWGGENPHGVGLWEWGKIGSRWGGGIFLTWHWCHKDETKKKKEKDNGEKYLERKRDKYFGDSNKIFEYVYIYIYIKENMHIHI